MTVVALPQPREGIAGRSRPDDAALQSQELSVIIGRLTTRLYRASIGPSENQRQLFEQLTHPQPGDLVVIADAFASRNDLDSQDKAVGYLLAIREEWAQTDEVWAAEEAVEDEGDRLIEDHAVYVQYGPAVIDVCRWTNCQVLTAEDRP